MIFNRRYQRILRIALPAQVGTLTYNGQTQNPVWQNYDRTKMTMNGVTSSVNAGTFTATFTPKSGYCWEDGSREAKNVIWSIGKAAGSLSFSATSVAINISALTKTITVTRAGDGAITATSSNTSVATVSVSGTTVTITGKNNGSATITVSVAAGTNHTATSKTVSVTADLPSRTLAECTPAQIQATAKAGQAPNWWNVGDKVPIKLSGTVGALTLNDTYYAFIVGFNHNASIEGNNTIHFQFCTADGTDTAFIDAGYSKSYFNNNNARFVMNTIETNVGGWKDSYMRNTICAQFFNVLPAEWRSIIAPCTKYSDNTGGGNDTASYVTSTLDKIWLLSEFEVYGTRTYANSAEKNYQKQYDYYKSNYKGKRWLDGEYWMVGHWSLRSVYKGNISGFCSGYSNDNPRYVSGDHSCIFAPGFMVA